MKILVVGKLCADDIRTGNQAGHDTFTYVSDIEDAVKVLSECKAELLVVDGQEESLGGLFAELNGLSRRVKLVLLHREQPYFMMADNSMNTAINYHIPMPQKCKIEMMW